VLVVDDEPRLRHLVEGILTSAGFRVVAADDGDAVLRLVRKHSVDVVLLDLNMPRVSGLEALRALRAAREAVGVVILAADGEEAVVLAAFEAGADDYVTKPFRSRVLLARIRAVLRRADRHRRHTESGTRVAGMDLDPLTRTARAEGRRVALSATEYQLLRVLMRSVGRVFTSDELLIEVWGPAYVGHHEIVRSNIYRLRRKLEPVPTQPRYVQGRRGGGYYFGTGDA
jgi:two-component system response regulator ResD